MECLARRRKRLLEDDKLLTVSPALEAKKSAILKMDVSQLRKGLFEGKFTSVDLVNIYGSRCRTLGVSHNLITEENFVEALDLAVQKDKERDTARRQGKLDELPPLHGIPFSVKDMIK